MRIPSMRPFVPRPSPGSEVTTPGRHPLSIPAPPPASTPASTPVASTHPASTPLASIPPVSTTTASLRPASIVIPTRGRPAYLEVALASIAPQAAAAGAEVVVVDDAGPSPAVRELTERFGARYEPHPGPRGLNVARNTGVACSRGELVVFVDDDVRVAPGWLAALLAAARERPEVQVFTGPIRPRLEARGGWARYSCGREGPPITALDLGPRDTDGVRYAWGANMAVRRAALERVGPFDVTLRDGGDEQEWQDRLAAVRGRERGWGGRAPNPRAAVADGDRNGSGGALYVAAAALDHRRTGADAGLRALARTAHARGRAARRFDARGGRAPSLLRELTTLAGCVGHVVRYRCPAGLTMVAHSLGRLREAVRERWTATGDPSPEDFLSGESGTVGGLDAVRRRVQDELVDAVEVASGRRGRLARAARGSRRAGGCWRSASSAPSTGRWRVRSGRSWSARATTSSCASARRGRRGSSRISTGCSRRARWGSAARSRGGTGRSRTATGWWWSTTT